MEVLILILFICPCDADADSTSANVTPTMSKTVIDAKTLVRKGMSRHEVDALLKERGELQLCLGLSGTETVLYRRANLIITFFGDEVKGVYKAENH